MLDAQFSWKSGLPQIGVVHAGGHSYALAPGLKAIAFDRILDDLKSLR